MITTTDARNAAKQFFFFFYIYQFNSRDWRGIMERGAYHLLLLRNGFGGLQCLRRLHFLCGPELSLNLRFASIFRVFWRRVADAGPCESIRHAKSRCGINQAIAQTRQGHLMRISRCHLLSYSAPCLFLLSPRVSSSFFLLLLFFPSLIFYGGFFFWSQV